MKTIIEMAHEAGLERGGYWEFDLIRLKRFATLVRADEREACALIGDSMDPLQDGAIGRAIRARGQA